MSGAERAATSFRGYAVLLEEGTEPEPEPAPGHGDVHSSPPTRSIGTVILSRIQDRSYKAA